MSVKNPVVFLKLTKYKFAVINIFISSLNSVKHRVTFVIKAGKVTISTSFIHKSIQISLIAYALFPKLGPQWKKIPDPCLLKGYFTLLRFQRPKTGQSV